MKYKITFFKNGESYSWEVLYLLGITTDLIQSKLDKGYFCKIEKL